MAAIVGCSSIADSLPVFNFLTDKLTKADDKKSQDKLSCICDEVLAIFNPGLVTKVLPLRHVVSNHWNNLSSRILPDRSDQSGNKR